MDLRKLKKLIDLVEQSGIAELEITEGEERVRIARVGAAGPVQIVGNVPAGCTAAVWRGSPVRRQRRPPKPAEPEGHVVKSPMVGTFYRASVARRADVRGGGLAGQGGGDPLHHRSDEAPERDRVRQDRAS